MNWLVLAATPPVEPLDESKIQPGLIGLAFFLVMAIAVVFLARSMRKRLANIDVDRHAREKAAREQAAGRERELDSDGT